MDALSDPTRFSSLAEKRQQQMKDMGIEESDISEVPAAGVVSEKGNKKANEKNNAKPTTPSTSTPGTIGNNTGGPSNTNKKEKEKGTL